MPTTPIATLAAVSATTAFRAATAAARALPFAPSTVDFAPVEVNRGRALTVAERRWYAAEFIAAWDRARGV